jgi:carbon storage regulator CsrA
MLKVKRREGEALILETSDGPITIRLTEYNGNQTRVGIDAPQSVRIVREELSFTRDTSTVEL